MKDITVLIRVDETYHKADKTLVNYLLWQALFRDGANFERAYPIKKMLVHSIEETPPTEIPF